MLNFLIVDEILLLVFCYFFLIDCERYSFVFDKLDISVLVSHLTPLINSDLILGSQLLICILALDFWLFMSKFLSCDFPLGEQSTLFLLLRKVLFVLVLQFLYLRSKCLINAGFMFRFEGGFNLNSSNQRLTLLSLGLNKSIGSYNALKVVEIGLNEVDSPTHLL